MAKRRCKFGKRRDGTCRKTKCRRKLTKQGFCPKGAGGTRKRRRRTTRKSTKRRVTQKSRDFAKALYIVRATKAAQEGRPYTGRVPLIGDDSRSRSNYGRSSAENAAAMVRAFRGGRGE